MKYNVGDKVRIKSLDWYNKNKDEYGFVRCIDVLFTPEHSKYCGCEFTVAHITEFQIPSYVMENNGHKWTDEMIEGLVEDETKPLTYEETVEIIEAMQGIGDSWECPQGYQFVDENGNVINAMKIVLEKKKNEYPKTYEECYKIMGVKLSDCYIQGYKSPLLEDLQELLICRDAYWKLYGEEMGLGKPWKNGRCEVVYGICRDYDDIVKQDDYWGGAHIFEFPIREMRDAFYENFKREIEICKEFL